MTCENCGAPARLDRDRGLFVCDYCGSEFVPPAGEDGVQVLGETKCQCPACEGLLSDGRLELHELLYCTHCRGMLIGMDDFLPLIETLRSYRERPVMTVAPRQADAGKLPRLCPRCSQPMDNHPYGGPGNVVIDTCESCSVNWLDKGEIQKIVAAPDYACPVPVNQIPTEE
jgi:Zn-finger nucleic acid-binding protein